MDESSLFARPQNPIIICWSPQPVVYHHHMTCLDNTDRDDLHRKLGEIADKPTQRLMVGILYKVGISVPTIADWFDMRGNTVYNWFDRIDNESINHAIYDDSPSGRPAKLDDHQKQQLKDVLHESPEDAGYDEPVWVPQLARQYIKDDFDVEYSVRHVRDLMSEAGMSWQTPRPQPASADPEEREQFSEHFQDEWKELKEANYTVVAVDQTRKTVGSDLYRAWFPEGERVSLPVSASRKGVNLLGAVTDEGETVFLESGGSFTGEVTIHLLKALQEKFGEKIAVVWDNASYFTAKVVKDFVEETPIKVFQLPTGSPDMNPAEGCWQQFKQNLGNRYFGNLDELREAIWPVLSSITPPDFHGNFSP